jgi:transposase
MKAPGPRPVPDRQCLQGILYVPHTGIGWEDLPQELGFRSGMTCWRRIKRWINAGVFDDLYRILLAQLNPANEIDWSRALIDGSHIDTKKGVPDLEFAPISSPHVSGVEDHARDVDEAGVIDSVQHRLVRPAPHPAATRSLKPPSGPRSSPTATNGSRTAGARRSPPRRSPANSSPAPVTCCTRRKTVNGQRDGHDRRPDISAGRDTDPG